MKEEKNLTREGGRERREGGREEGRETGRSYHSRSRPGREHTKQRLGPAPSYCQRGPMVLHPPLLPSLPCPRRHRKGWPPRRGVRGKVPREGSKEGGREGRRGGSGDSRWVGISVVSGGQCSEWRKDQGRDGGREGGREGTYPRGAATDGGRVPTDDGGLYGLGRRKEKEGEGRRREDE